ncbi:MULTISPECIES: hypothetical protein [Nocardia]|uniref:hypothetical protein n=1 Tax=Nocardia TaxID=1817 RepID=UPI00292EF954|nr:hypothetical protein [Nocardia canadensis]
MADGGGAQNPLSAILPGLDQQVSGRQQQSGAEQQQESLSHGGVDPKYIPEFEPFDGMSHEDIYNAVQQMQPGVMQQFGDQWVAMFTEISGAVTGLMIQTARASSSLHGEFASAGEAAGRKFITEATDVYTVLSAVGHRVKAAAYGAEAVKVAVPAPVNATEGSNVGTSVPATLAELSVPGSAAATEREKDDRRQQAIAAMKMTYMPTYGPAGENVPTFVAPTQPGTGGGTDDPGTGGGGSNNGGTTGGGGTTTDDGTTTGENPGTTEETTQPGTTTDDDTTTAGTDTDDSGGSDDSQGDDSSSTNPASTTPASTTPATTTPGTSPGGGGSPGSGSPGGSSPGGATLTPGGSVAGRAPAGVGQNLAAAGLSGAAGAASAGRGMSPGMMGAPGARGGGKDDEQEHSAPDYLRRVQPELFGDDVPAVPGAIGADAPATRVADQDQGGAGAS